MNKQTIKNILWKLANYKSPYDTRYSLLGVCRGKDSELKNRPHQQRADRTAFYKHGGSDKLSDETVLKWIGCFIAVWRVMI